MLRRAVAVLALLGFVVTAGAGEFNKKLSIGAAAPAWKDLPGIDGKKHSLADLKDKDVVVVVFTANECPVSCDYETRLVGFATKYAGPEARAAMVAVNVCTGPDEALPKMAERAKKRGFPFVYLSDPSQQLGRDYGAIVTPQFFVLNKERKVVYMGAMDDHMNAAKVKETYLDKVIEAVLKGEKLSRAETRAHGCSIEYVTSPK